LKTPFLNSKTLKSELAKGNEKALNFLMDLHHHSLSVYAYSLSHDTDTAKDIVQNVFIRLWEKRDDIQKIQSIKDFLYKSVYNEFINQYRKDIRRSLAYNKKHTQALSYIVESLDEDLLKKQVGIVKLEIEKLPSRCKETFLLSKQDGLTNAEIANYMKVSTKTVERQITKAFDILRTKLKSDISPLLFLLFSRR